MGGCVSVVNIEAEGWMLLRILYFGYSNCERLACRDTHIKFGKSNQDNVMIMV